MCHIIKSISVVCILILSFSNIVGQSNIGFSVGMDITMVKTGYRSGIKDFSQTDIGYKENLLFGFRAEHQVSKSFFLALQGDFCMKKFDIYEGGIAPRTGLKYPKYGIGLSLNWLPTPFFSVGIGPEYYRIPKQYNLRSYSVNSISTVVWERIGGLLAIHFFYHQFLLDINYHQGVKIQRENGFNTLNFSLCYLLKLSKNKKKKEKNNRF